MKFEVGKTYLVRGTNSLENDALNTEWIVELLAEPNDIFVHKTIKKIAVVHVIGFRHKKRPTNWDSWFTNNERTIRTVYVSDIVAELTAERPRQDEFGGYFVKEWA